MKQTANFKSSNLYTVLIAICHANGIATPEESEFYKHLEIKPLMRAHDVACDLTVEKIKAHFLAKGKDLKIELDYRNDALIVNGNTVATTIKFGLIAMHAHDKKDTKGSIYSKLVVKEDNKLYIGARSKQPIGYVKDGALYLYKPVEPDNSLQIPFESTSWFEKFGKWWCDTGTSAKILSKIIANCPQFITNNNLNVSNCQINYFDDGRSKMIY